MSNARVKVNGKDCGYWPYGYNSFYIDATGAAKPGTNELVVELENFERASRWYPGAGLYRNVHVLATDRVHIPRMGHIHHHTRGKDYYATVSLNSKIEGARKGEKVEVNTTIIAPDGKTVASDKSSYHAHGQDFTQNFLVENPTLWSLDSPALYTAHTTLSVDGKEVDSYDTRFGIRTIEYIPEKGFFLNGKVTKFKGVCNHHDLGPLRCCRKPLGSPPPDRAA